MFRFLAVVFPIWLSSCEPASVTIEPEPETEEVLEFEDCSQNLDAHPCNFSLMDQHGDMVELYDFYGKVIIVDFSAMWCGPCASMAQFADPIVGEYGAENLEWLTIIIEDEQGNPPDQDDLLRWATTNGITGHVLAGDRSLIATDSELKSGYPISGWPTFVVIDEEMVLKHGIRGWSESVLRQILDTMIEDNDG